MLGTNGGGFFNANSAHPFETPTPFSNLVEMLSIFTLGAGLIYMFGNMARNRKQGWILFAAVSFVFLLGAFIALGSEQAGNPQIPALRGNQTPPEPSLPHPAPHIQSNILRLSTPP